MIDSRVLAASLSAVAGIGPKTAASVHFKDDHPASDVDLQNIVGDPDDTAISTFAQRKPNPGDQQLPNPLSPIEGDEIFFTYLIPGARFQAHDGSWWDIEEYDWDGKVAIRDPWNARRFSIVSVYDIRRSIHSWIEPVQQRVPPPPPGYDYGTISVRVVDK